MKSIFILITQLNQPITMFSLSVFYIHRDFWRSKGSRPHSYWRGSQGSFLMPWCYTSTDMGLHLQLGCQGFHGVLVPNVGACLWTRKFIQKEILRPGSSHLYEYYSSLCGSNIKPRWNKKKVKKKCLFYIGVDNYLQNGKQKEGRRCCSKFKIYKGEHYH